MPLVLPQAMAAFAAAKGKRGGPVAGAQGPTGRIAPKVQRAGAQQRPGQPQRQALLLPPQLQGRSNIVTEDLDRLFVKKAKASGAGSPTPVGLPAP